MMRCPGRRHWLALSLLAVAVVAPASASDHIRHPFLAKQSAKVPDEAVLAVEIPAGSFTKYEIGEDGLKVIGVPTDKIDPTYAGIRDLADLPQIERDRIEAFFRVYKDLPKGRNPVQLNGYGDAKEAKALIQASLERFSAQP